MFVLAEVNSWPEAYKTTLPVFAGEAIAQVHLGCQMRDPWLTKCSILALFTSGVMFCSLPSRQSYEKIGLLP